MNKRTLILAGVLIVLAIILFILPSFLRKSATIPAPTNTMQTQPAATTANIAVFPLEDTKVSALTAQAQNEFDFAFTKAKEWRNDSSPVAVIIKYAGSIDDRNGKNTYIFISPSLSQYYYTLTFDQAKNERRENNFQRILYFKEDYFLPANTAVLPLNFWKLSYLDALKKADDLGGKNIRTDNQNYDVNLVLSAQTGAFLMWDAEYLIDKNKMFSVSINAYDGTVQ